MQQNIHFIQSPDGVSLAVATCGSGTPLIIIPGWISHLELEWDMPAARDFFERLAQDHLLVRYDKRGTGLSDRDVTDFSPEANIRDFEAIVDGLGLKKPAIMGYSQGGPIAVAYAVAHPENVSHLLLYGSYHDGTTAYFTDIIRGFASLMKADWGGFGSTAVVEMFAPGTTPEGRAFFATFMQQAASADAAIATFESLFDFRVTALLPEVRVPTLVLHRRGDKTCPFVQGREMAAKIPGARFVPLEGDIHVIHMGDTEPLIGAIQEFLGGQEGSARGAAMPEGLQTILFTDMVGSTASTQALGDETAQELVRLHNEIVRSQLRMWGGVEVKHTGDGIMATFPSATRAITCGVGIQMAVLAHNAQHPNKLGIRIGLNAGEPISEGHPDGRGDLFGTAVQLAARICGEAQTGEVLTSRVVYDLAAGKGFTFVDKGDVDLKGFSEPSRLYQALP